MLPHGASHNLTLTLLQTDECSVLDPLLAAHKGVAKAQQERQGGLHRGVLHKGILHGSTAAQLQAHVAFML